VIIVLITIIMIIVIIPIMRNVPINGKFLACKRKKLKIRQTAKSRRLRVWNGFMHTKSRRISTTLYIRSSTFMHTRSRVHSRVLASPFRVALLKYSSTYQHPSSRIADSISVHAKHSFCHLRRVSTPPRAPISTSNQHCIELTLQCYRMTQ